MSGSSTRAVGRNTQLRGRIGDDLGRISPKTDTTQAGTDDFAYRYDEGGHLIEVKRGGQAVESYTYDSNGNRTSATRADGVTLNATYDAQDRLKSFGSHTYGYSKNGDLTSLTDNGSGEATSLQFDSLGNLKQVTTEGGEQIAYLTDPLDRRIGKKVDGQLVQGFLYGDDLGPEAELNPDGSVKARFVYGTSAVTPDYMVKAGKTYRIVSDERYSPRLVVNTETGAIAQELDYDSYGRVVEDTSPGFQPFGFAGGLYDRDTGLTHFGAREYDAEAGRFISQDPLDFAGGDTNLYAYVWGDPVNTVDPEGLGGFSIHGITSGLSHAARSAMNFDVAAANVITFGGVNATLTLTGGLSQIDVCSGSYKAGTWAGIAIGLFIPGSELAAGREVAEGGSLLTRLRAIKWADETGSIGRHTPEQEYLTQLAQEAKKIGISRDDAEALAELAKEAGLKAHPPMIHEGRPGFGGTELHIKIGKLHIPVQ